MNISCCFLTSCCNSDILLYKHMSKHMFLELLLIRCLTSRIECSCPLNFLLNILSSCLFGLRSRRFTWLYFKPSKWINFIHYILNIHCCLFLPPTYIVTFSYFMDKKYSFYLKSFFFFGPHWVFVAVRGLSLVAASRGYSSLRCVGFSLQWLLLLRSTGPRVCGLQ